ncbi:MAG: hypothetical protein ACREFQ_10840 [Stellaceae bacterium]
MAKKRMHHRMWSKHDVQALRSGAKRRVGAMKLARVLKRTVAAVRRKASTMGLSLQTSA